MWNESGKRQRGFEAKEGESAKKYQRKSFLHSGDDVIAEVELEVEPESEGRKGKVKKERRRKFARLAWFGLVCSLFLTREELSLFYLNRNNLSSGSPALQLFQISASRRKSIHDEGDEEEEESFSI